VWQIFVGLCEHCSTEYCSTYELAFCGSLVLVKPLSWIGVNFVRIRNRVKNPRVSGCVWVENDHPIYGSEGPGFPDRIVPSFSDLLRLVLLLPVQETTEYEWVYSY